MKKLILILFFTISKNALSVCIHEKEIVGMNLAKLNEAHQVFIKTEENKFIAYENFKINPLRKYQVQFKNKLRINNLNSQDYNKKYVEYYSYPRIQEFISEKQKEIEKLSYETAIVGKSIEGRNLYSIRPKSIVPTKKTILIFGRHHGDEGTANWIIEGFINKFLSASTDFHEKYQLVLYPMVNPDGAERRTRYNKNNRDLNRSWSSQFNRAYDEVKTIHKDLKTYIDQSEDIIIALDMHGSFTEDFIYRVKRNYISLDFFNHQQELIDELGSFDRWQEGNFQLSNGHPKMARIVLINSYQLNALTHETPRDIKLINRNGRSKASLLIQGNTIFQSILGLY